MNNGPRQAVALNNPFPCFTLPYFPYPENQPQAIPVKPTFTHPSNASQHIQQFLFNPLSPPLHKSLQDFPSVFVGFNIPQVSLRPQDEHFGSKWKTKGIKYFKILRASFNCPNAPLIKRSPYNQLNHSLPKRGQTETRWTVIDLNGSILVRVKIANYFNVVYLKHWYKRVKINILIFDSETALCHFHKVHQTFIPQAECFRAICSYGRFIWQVHTATDWL